MYIKTVLVIMFIAYLMAIAFHDKKAKKVFFCIWMALITLLSLI